MYNLLKLKKIRDVNEIYVKLNAKGLSNEYIYKHYIRERFYISRATFYEYLTIPYKSMERKLQA